MRVFDMQRGTSFPGGPSVRVRKPNSGGILMKKYAIFYVFCLTALLLAETVLAQGFTGPQAFEQGFHPYSGLHGLSLWLKPAHLPTKLRLF